MRSIFHPKHAVLTETVSALQDLQAPVARRVFDTEEAPEDEQEEDEDEQWEEDASSPDSEPDMLVCSWPAAVSFLDNIVSAPDSILIEAAPAPQDLLDPVSTHQGEGDKARSKQVWPARCCHIMTTLRSACCC